MNADLAASGALVVIATYLAVFDLRRMRLPDPAVALLAIVGLTVAAVAPGSGPTLSEALVGGLLAFVLLAAVRALHRRLRGLDGLGFGDVKLAAAGGLWLGPAAIGPMLLLACAATAAVLVIRTLRGEAIDAERRIPFGPALCLAIVGLHSTA